MKIDLSIIIVNYNSKDYLKNCLDSIFKKIKDINFEIIVVDNNSSDGSKELLKEDFPEAHLIESEKNLGFAGANNLGIKVSKGNYIFLLNPDTLILGGDFKKLILFLNQHPQIGILGPKVLNSDLTFQKQCKRGWPNFWNSFCYVSGLWRVFNKSQWQRRVFGGYFLLDKSEKEEWQVDQVSGAAMIIRREVFNQIGLFDPSYFLYWEDSDFCFRAKKANYKIYYYPYIEIIHYGGKGGTEAAPFKNLWYFHRNLFIFYKKYLAPKNFFIVNLLYYFFIFLVFILKCFLNLFRKKKIIGSLKPEP